jgi:KaiC/GvpD/RAD55 family RecA-like ATPase
LGFVAQDGRGTVVRALHGGQFIDAAHNVVLIGGPGTGKCHLAKVVAYQATLQGHDVRYMEADTEFSRYALGYTTERGALFKEWVEPDLLVLDDLFLSRPAGGGRDESDSIGTHERARPVCLPQGRADPAAYAQGQPYR